LQRAAGNRAGVVDQDVAVAGEVRQRLDVFVLRQVEGVRGHGDAMALLDVVGHDLELLGVGRGEDEIASFRIVTTATMRPVRCWRWNGPSRCSATP
jgi:hypothetical protein